jgi:hypothetical protein
MEWPAPSVPQLKAKLAWQSEEEWKMQIAVLGIDLGKNSCSLAQGNRVKEVRDKGLAC